MDVTSFALAALRLAPVQCAGWGHPVTTGHATIDAYFTCARDGARRMATRTTRETARCACRASAPITRGPRCRATRRGSAFGLREGDSAAAVPAIAVQDPSRQRRAVRARARTVPAAQLVLFEGRHPKLTEKFRARLSVAFAREGLGVDDRVVFLRQCGHDDFLRVNAVCDAMLDTQRWSGGNTSLDALAAGLPIVTLPGRFMRGRQSAAMLSRMGLDELVAADAEDYVRIAARTRGRRAVAGIAARADARRQWPCVRRSPAGRGARRRSGEPGVGGRSVSDGARQRTQFRRQRRARATPRG